MSEFNVLTSNYCSDAKDGLQSAIIARVTRNMELAVLKLRPTGGSRGSVCRKVETSPRVGEFCLPKGRDVPSCRGVLALYKDNRAT